MAINIKPDSIFAESVTIKNSAGTTLHASKPASALLNESWMRDPGDNVGFYMNAADVPDALPLWDGIAGTLKITWAAIPSLTYQVYAVHPFSQGQQLLFVCAPSGSSSLDPVTGSGVGVLKVLTMRFRYYYNGTTYLPAYDIVFNNTGITPSVGANPNNWTWPVTYDGLPGVEKYAFASNNPWNLVTEINRGGGSNIFNIRTLDYTGSGSQGMNSDFWVTLFIF